MLGICATIMAALLFSWLFSFKILLQIGFLFKSINFEKERYLNTRFLSKIVDYKTNDRNNFYWRNLMDWNITHHGKNSSSFLIFVTIRVDVETC